MAVNVTEIETEVYESDNGDIIEFDGFRWAITLYEPNMRREPDAHFQTLGEALVYVDDHYETFG